jgi:hypothetical protein
MFCLGNGVCLKTKKKIPYVPFWFNNKFHTKTLTSLSTCDCVAWKLLCYHILKEWFWFRNIQFEYIFLSLQNSFCGFILLKNHSQIVLLLGFWKENLRKALLFLPMYSKQWYMKKPVSSVLQKVLQNQERFMFFKKSWQSDKKSQLTFLSDPIFAVSFLQ